VLVQICLVSATILEKPELSVLRLLGLEVDATMLVPNKKWLRGLAGLPLIYVDMKFVHTIPGLSKISMTEHWKSFKALARHFGTYVICAHAVILTPDFPEPKRGEQPHPKLEQYLREGQPGAGLFHMLGSDILEFAEVAFANLGLPGAKNPRFPHSRNGLEI